MASVVGAGSAWTNTGSLTIGASGTGTLHVFGGGAITATSVSVNSSSLLAIDVGRDSSLTVNNGTGTLTNNGTVRILAGANVPANATFTPISAAWSDTAGTYQALGGTWDTENHFFRASAVQPALAGSTVTVDLASIQRILATDNTTGWSLGASFLAATTSTSVTFNATTISGDTLNLLKTKVDDDESIRSAWTCSTTNYTVGTSKPVYLSLSVGADYSFDDLTLWHYDGTAWSKYDAPDLTYDGQYASFTATSSAATPSPPCPSPARSRS